jgi:hypothetical protein
MVTTTLEFNIRDLSRGCGHARNSKIGFAGFSGNTSCEGWLEECQPFAALGIISRWPEASMAFDRSLIHHLSKI